MSASNRPPALEVKDLKTHFHTQDGTVHAVNGVSFDVHEGELLGVVGESGSGKSVTMMSLLRLIPMPPGEIVQGEANFDGKDLLQVDQQELRAIRGGDIGFIFQDPMTSLNPVFTVGFQIMEPLRMHLGLNKAYARKRAAELLELVGIPSASQRLRDYPHQFSGGMRQRVMIAIALACDPKVLIADEATTALDVTVQAQIIELIKDLREKLGMAIIWITHDLGVVAENADVVAVMYAGRVVEYAGVHDIFSDPLHPYTRGLFESMPVLGETKKRLNTIPGAVPNPAQVPTGCAFHPRCKDWDYDLRCKSQVPALLEVKQGHWAACWHVSGYSRGKPTAPNVAYRREAEASIDST